MKQLTKMPVADLHQLFSSLPFERRHDSGEWGDFEYKRARPCASADGSFALEVRHETRHKLTLRGDTVWGADEFMLVLEGSVELTDGKGDITRIEAGEALFIPADWQGEWCTDGNKRLSVTRQTAAAAGQEGLLEERYAYR